MQRNPNLKQFISMLYEKVKSEYDSFIADIRDKPADTIIACAYEIVSKGEIATYCQGCAPSLTTQQYEALLSSRNTLHEIYEQWCKNGALHGLEDIGVALEEAADRIRISIERNR